MSESVKVERPECVTDEHLEYLDRLRESAITNMLGAGEYLESRFSLDKNTARTVLTYWMNSFGNPDR